MLSVDVQVGEAAGEATPIGINGQHVIMGEYSQVPDNPQRLTVTFKSEWAFVCVVECRVLSTAA